LRFLCGLFFFVLSAFSEEVTADVLVSRELGSMTVGYADEEAPPPDADFTASAKMIATVRITPPSDRSTVKVRLSCMRMQLSVAIRGPLALQPIESVNVYPRRSYFEDETKPKTRAKSQGVRASA